MSERGEPVYDRVPTQTFKRAQLEEADVIEFYLKTHGESIKKGSLRLLREGSLLCLEWSEP